MLAGQYAWGNVAGSAPPDCWRSAPKRWSYNTLWRTFRIELWHHPDFRATYARSQHNWLTNQPLWHNLFNAVLTSART